MAPPRRKERLNAISRYALVRAKVERAKQNLRDLESSQAAFHGDVPGAKRYVPSKKRPSGQVHVYRTTFDTLTAAGDVLNNLRGALDHLITQLSLARFPRLTQKQMRTCQFPIYKSKAVYESRKGEDIKFIRPEAVKLIDSLKPYKEGNHALWMLNELNNTSKHRLILNVGQVVMCHADWISEFSLSPAFMYKVGRPQFIGIWARPEMHDYVLPTGKESLIKLRPGRREALLPALEYLTNVVDALLKQFLPYLG
jgi:hypothetical protein